MDLLVHCAGRLGGTRPRPSLGFCCRSPKPGWLGAVLWRQTRRYGEQMTTQHNRIMIYSPKANGTDQDGRPAARHVLSRSRFRTIQICPKDLPIRSVAGW